MIFKIIEKCKFITIMLLQIMSINAKILNFINDIIENQDNDQDKITGSHVKISNDNCTDKVKNDFEWIRKYCDYSFDDMKNLICVNRNGNTFKIDHQKIYGFAKKKIWKNNKLVIKTFTDSVYDFDYSGQDIQIKINDYSLNFNDSNLVPKTQIIEEIEIENNCVQINVYCDKIKVNTLNCTEEFISSFDKNCNDIVTDWIYEELEKKYPKSFEKYLRLKLTCKHGYKYGTRIIFVFNQYFTKLITKKYGEVNVKNASTLIESLRSYELKQESFKNNIKKIIIEIKKHCESEEGKLYHEYEDIRQQINQEGDKTKSPEYDEDNEPMLNPDQESEQKSVSDKELASYQENLEKKSLLLLENIKFDQQMLKIFVTIWKIRTIQEFMEKNNNLESEYLQLANFLYTKDRNKRELLLLENGIFTI